MGISPEVRFGAVVCAVSVVAGDTEDSSIHDRVIDSTDEREIFSVSRLKAKLVTADNPTARTEAGGVQAVDNLCP